MCTDTSDKEGLPKDNRPGLIPVMRSDHPGVPKNTSWDILFLRLEGTHLHSQGGEQVESSTVVTTSCCV